MDINKNSATADSAGEPNKYLVVYMQDNVAGRTFVCSAVDILDALIQFSDQAAGNPIDARAGWVFLKTLIKTGDTNAAELVSDYNIFSKETQNIVKITGVFRINAQLYGTSGETADDAVEAGSGDRTNVQGEEKRTNVRSGEDELRTYVLFRSEARGSSDEDRVISCVEAPDFTSAMINLGKIPLVWSDIFPAGYMKDLLEAAEHAGDTVDGTEYGTKLVDIYNRYSKYSRVEEIYEAAEVLYPNKCLDNAAGCFRYQNSPAYFYNKRR